MRKFLSYMFAGALVSSLSVLACSSDSTRDDGDDDDTTSSSSGAAADGGSSSGKTGSSSSGGGSSSGGSSSSSGSTTPEFELTGMTIAPATAKVGTASNHTFELTYTGNPANAEGRVSLLFGLAGQPAGVTASPFTANDFDDLTEDGKVTGTFTINPTVAGTYKIAAGFDADQDEATKDDQVVETADLVVSE